jgi:hypothetical protein
MEKIIEKRLGFYILHNLWQNKKYHKTLASGGDHFKDWNTLKYLRAVPQAPVVRKKPFVFSFLLKRMGFFSNPIHHHPHYM